MINLYRLLAPYYKMKNTGFFLFGHGVTAKKFLDPFIQGLHIPLDVFASMVELWEKMGFVFLSMEQASEIVLHGKKTDYPWIHITFDDGYKNNFTTAYPFLKSKKIPFTIFLSTRNIVEQKRFDNYLIACAIQHTAQAGKLSDLIAGVNGSNDVDNRKGTGDKVIHYFKYLSAPEKIRFLEKVKALLSDTEWNTYNALYDSEDVLTPGEVKSLSKDPLVCIGSHGHNHYILSTLDEPQINYEFLESKKWITELTGKEPYAYCFPNGKLYDFPKDVDKLCKSHKYALAFTTVKKKYEYTDSQYSIPRLPISNRYLPMLFAKLM